jgi:hypothetical protein
MKMNLRLGVPTEALLKHPTACFRLSKAATRVSTALSFSEHYFKNLGASPLQRRDLEHISASIYTSGRSAEELAKLVEDQSLKKEIEAYSRAAARFNQQIRSNLPKAKAKATKEAKPITMTSLVDRAQFLRNKLVQIEKKVEDLCTVNPAANEKPRPTPAGSSTMHGRVSMSGIIHKKKPMYPRYFVASMGRSRR